MVGGGSVSGADLVGCGWGELTGLPVMESPRAMIRIGVPVDWAEVSDIIEARRVRKNRDGSMLTIGLRRSRQVLCRGKVVSGIYPCLRTY